ncbi:hypothetical protein [uncultured Maritalea sp.]|uniref:hypothetical protein n=1 Tax=uncultured Maritalea sp. TaxID=757249 RepID=UPI002602CD4F|nr:hypothetical protein [uncultured Maritalea sp.]
MLSVDKLLSRTGIAVAISLVAIPAFWPSFSQVEGQLLPVTTPMEVEELGSGPNYVDVAVSFEKLRQCEFIGLSWYDDAYRLVVDFEAGAKNAPLSRPVGPQEIGPWRLHGTTTIQGTHAVTTHRCHPLWLTFTQTYP